MGEPEFEYLVFDWTVAVLLVGGVVGLIIAAWWRERKRQRADILNPRGRAWGGGEWRQPGDPDRNP